MVIRSPYPDPVIPDVSLASFVLDGPGRRQQHTALIDGSTEERMSYAELEAAVWRTTAALQAHGLRKGDVFAICLSNVPEFVVAYYAVLSAGGAVTTLHPAIGEPEARAQLHDSKARWLLTTPELAASLAAVIRESNVEEVFVVGSAPPGTTSFAALPASSREAPVQVDVEGADLAALLYSSGTTGVPKGVMLTHRNLVAGVCTLQVPDPVSDTDVVLLVLPLSHIAGMEIALNHALWAGATVVLMQRFELEHFLALIQRHRVTRIIVAPPIILALAKHPSVDDYDLSSLRLLASGAAPLDGSLAELCMQRVGCRVKQGYGMTETGAVSMAPDDGPSKPDSIGPPTPGTQCRIVDPGSGRDLAPGATGELLARTPSCMAGYLGNPEATARTIDADGWLHTGDLVRVDADGWLHVVDRVKELIKYKGHQVPPAELEAILLTHPAIADAAVVPSPDGESGEVPKAFVVLRARVHEPELIAWVNGQVASYKKVRRMEVIDAIPKSPSGKILRRLLVERERETVARQARERCA